MLTKHCAIWLSYIFSIIAALNALFGEAVEKVQQDFCISKGLWQSGLKNCTNSIMILLC